MENEELGTMSDLHEDAVAYQMDDYKSRHSGETIDDAVDKVPTLEQDMVAVKEKNAEQNEKLSELASKVEEIDDRPTGGVSSTARTLLKTLLQNAIYSSDQSANIDALIKELEKGGEDPSKIYYDITYVLPNCSSSSSVSRIERGKSYTTTINANAGYELRSLSYSMGGSNYPVEGNVISIPNVTGDIIISADAIKVTENLIKGGTLLTGFGVKYKENGVLGTNTVINSVAVKLDFGKTYKIYDFNYLVESWLLGCYGVSLAVKNGDSYENISSSNLSNWEYNRLGASTFGSHDIGTNKWFTTPQVADFHDAPSEIYVIINVNYENKTPELINEVKMVELNFDVEPNEDGSINYDVVYMNGIGAPYDQKGTISIDPRYGMVTIPLQFGSSYSVTGFINDASFKRFKVALAHREGYVVTNIKSSALKTSGWKATQSVFDTSDNIYIDNAGESFTFTTPSVSDFNDIPNELILFMNSREGSDTCKTIKIEKL